MLPELRADSIRRSHTGRNTRQAPDANHDPHGGCHRIGTLRVRIESEHRVDVRGLGLQDASIRRCPTAGMQASDVASLMDSICPP
jgi:hypothetical protein